jgi:hypothetical protein
MFRLAPGSRDPVPWFVFGKCEVFRTSVIQVERQEGVQQTVIPLNSFSDPAWLSPNAYSRSMEEGRYLLVFEETSDDSPVFRLARDAHEAYFKLGWVMRLVEDRKYQPAEVKDAHDSLEKVRSTLEVEARIDAPTRVCHRVTNDRIVESDASPVELANCSEDAAVGL